MAYSVKKLAALGTIPKWTPVVLMLVVTTAEQLRAWYEGRIDTFTMALNLTQQYAIATLSYIAATR